jgi:iron complex outermembrane receptor protein
MDSLPTLARQQSGSTPGAVQQNAGVYNTTLFGALTYRSNFAKGFNNTTSFVFNHTDFVNPFITTYEKRRELNYSGRTDFSIYT